MLDAWPAPAATDEARRFLGTQAVVVELRPAVRIWHAVFADPSLS